MRHSASWSDGDAASQDEDVRQRYARRCGYCGVSEAEAGGELTVDHFRPVTAGGDDAEDNLVYACFRCNSYKSDFFPSADDARLGRRLLHPLLDRLGDHIREDPRTGRLEPLTDTGRFHLFLLRLNRPQLVEQRLARRLRQLLAEAYGLLRQDNEELRLRVVMLETYLHEITRRRPNETGTEPERS